MAEEARSDTGIGGTIGSAGTAVKEGIVGSLKGINAIETEIVNLVRSAVSNALNATGEVASDSVTVTRDVIKGTLQATEVARVFVPVLDTAYILSEADQQRLVAWIKALTVVTLS